MSSSSLKQVKAVRNWLKSKQLDAVIIPHEDEFLGEYLPKNNERLEWLTGFTGSAGVAIVTLETAAIFVDGRYTLQVKDEVSHTAFEHHHLIEEPYLEWLLEKLNSGARVGFDPRMHAMSWLISAKKTVSDKLSLIALDDNPIDELWTNRPAALTSPVKLMAEKFSGKSSHMKRDVIAQELKQKNVDAAILTELDSICWLLNIRALDVPHLPVLLSHAIIYSDSSLDFFVDSARLPNDFAVHVGENVRVIPPQNLSTQLPLSLENKRVMIDPSASNAWFGMTLENAKVDIIHDSDPCLLIKSIKNPTEIAGMKTCHIRDGVAMVKFLSWLDKEVAANRLHDEANLSDRLQQFREEDSSLIDLSFDTISAAGSNAAMCHYNHANQATPKSLSMNSFYLVDSGGQYPDGTTDITRTIAIGQPSDEMKKMFTFVLKGHIALARAHFPQGTKGHQLDVLARQFLWSHGYDYDHGTGHGVGHCLSVHEGPQRISKIANHVALQAGMVISNEPGYYRSGAFGIRIENLELITAIDTEGDFPVLGFESLTRCPIDIRAIDINRLTKPELKWLNAYHQKVWDDLSPLIEGDTKQWLKHATTPLNDPS